MVAKDLQSGAYKTYALARVRSAVLLDVPYETHWFVAKEFLKDGIGVFGQGQAETVEIEVREPLASYVSERRWHESQVITRIKTGIRLKMTVKVNDEFVRWVLGLGLYAKVVAPQKLRLAVFKHAIEISKNASEDAA